MRGSKGSADVVTSGKRPDGEKDLRRAEMSGGEKGRE
jgi:hypothetical protein